jgi:DNA-binding CsgD family transcriptional regulator
VILADRTLGIQTRFGLAVNLELGHSAQELLAYVPDPMIRTSFRNIFGYALAASARYDEASALMVEQVEDAARCRIDFAIPYALVTQALVLAGRRQYNSAIAVLAEADERASHSNDHTASCVIAAVRVRAYIAQGAFGAALEQAILMRPDDPRSLRAEVMACRALALSGVGDHKRALSLAGGALESVGVEATICGRATRAVVAHADGDHDRALEEARFALACTIQTGLVESFVAAYRGFPQLVVCLLGDRSLHADVAHVLRLVGDADALPPETRAGGDHSILKLSPREKEVLALLARGQTNPQIGRALFISPVTVKVHVRHIFDKLGVRSRAEAALRAAQLGRDDS